jgi:hypothetical protein
MTTAYETDVVAWANEQAMFIRLGKFDQLDLVHIAEEIEDVGKSEQRELASRMSILLAHLLKWQYQPERRGASWQTTIRTQRRGIELALEETPSLKTKLTDASWCERVWLDALDRAVTETGLNSFPETYPWDMVDILKEGWFPG